MPKKLSTTTTSPANGKNRFCIRGSFPSESSFGQKPTEPHIPPEGRRPSPGVDHGCLHVEVAGEVGRGPQPLRVVHLRHERLVQHVRRRPCRRRLFAPAPGNPASDDRDGADEHGINRRAGILRVVARAQAAAPSSGLSPGARCCNRRKLVTDAWQVREIRDVVSRCPRRPVGPEEDARATDLAESLR